MLKRALLFFLVISSTCFVSGQTNNKRKVDNLRSFDERLIHFGFLIGFNNMDFRVYNNGQPNVYNNQTPLYGEVVYYKPGLNIGMVTNYRINSALDLRFLPGISFGQRDLYYIDANGVQDKEPLSIKSTFIEFPLLLKYNALRMHNAKPYIVGGVNARYDLAKNVQDRLVLNSFDTYLEAGAGFDFYLTYFRLSVELKASIGMLDVLNHAGTGQPGEEQYTEAIDALKSRIFCLTFYFE